MERLGFWALLWGPSSTPLALRRRIEQPPELGRLHLRGPGPWPGHKPTIEQLLVFHAHVEEAGEALAPHVGRTRQNRYAKLEAQRRSVQRPAAPPSLPCRRRWRSRVEVAAAAAAIAAER